MATRRHPHEEAFPESGILLRKYWFEVSAEEQTRRFRSRMTDARKLWKVSPIDADPAYPYRWVREVVGK